MTDQYSTHPQAGQAVEAGRLLREARERAGLDIQQASGRIKIPVRIVQALENGQWQQLGAPVFVRGQLRSYARMLEVDISAYLEQDELRTVRPVELVSHTHTPRYQRMFENTARRALYVVITLSFFAVPIWLWLATPSDGPQRQTASLDVMPTQPAGDAATPPVAVSATQPQAAPIAASMTPPLPRPQAQPAVAALQLRVSGDSWVQINAADGSSIEKGLLKAGEQRDFEAGQVGSMVLGNASAVEVQHAGSKVDLTPYQRANVARFTVSSDGSLAPVQD